MHSQHWPIESWRQYSICYRLLIWIPQPSAHRKWVNPQAFGPFMRLYSTIIKFGTIQMVRFKIRATLFQHLVSFAATTSLVFSSCSPTLCAVPLIPTALPVASLHNTTDDTNDHTCLGFFFFFSNLGDEYCFLMSQGSCDHGYIHSTATIDFSKPSS